MNTIAPFPKHEIFEGGVGVSEGYAIGPARFINTTELILNADPDTPDDIPAHLTQIFSIVKNGLLADIDYLESEDLEKNEAPISVRRIQLDMLHRLKNRITSALTQNTSLTIHEYLRSYYKSLATNSQADAIAELVLKLMSENAQITDTSMSLIREGEIIIAGNMSIRDVAEITDAKIAGIITTQPQNSHLSTVAKGRGIPCISELNLIKDLTKIDGHEIDTSAIQDGTMVIIDGYKGIVHYSPSKEKIEYYTGLINADADKLAEMKKHAMEPCETLDGVPIHISANINDLDFERIKHLPFGSIGLVRMEPHLAKTREPLGVHALTTLFTASCEHIGADRSVTYRLPDIQFEDKRAEDILHKEQLALAIGIGEYRGAEFLIKNPAYTATFFRAFLETSGFHSLRSLVPYVEHPEQMPELRNILNETYQEILDDPNSSFLGSCIPLDAMIETASITQNIDTIIRTIELSDGISIGSNDLRHELSQTQRYQENATDHKDLEFNPDFIRILNEVCEISKRAKKPVSFCGDLASDVNYLPFIFALEAKPVTLEAQIYKVRDRSRRLRFSECKELFERVLKLENPEDIKGQLFEFNSRFYPKSAQILSSLGLKTDEPKATPITSVGVLNDPPTLD